MNNLDFLNLNTVRNYPIKDGLSCVSDDGLFTIPRDFVADLSIAAVGDVSTRLFISSVTHNSAYTIVEISIFNGSPVGTFYIPASTNNYTDITLTASTELPSSIGKLTIGMMDNITLQPSGTYSFSISATELLMRTYAPIFSGVSYISFIDAAANKVSLTGDVTILAESNLRFRQINNTIYLDAGEGLGLNKSCTNQGIPIKTINGIPADTSGNFTIIPQDCVSIAEVEYGLVLKDTCGQPCQGCSSISTLTSRLVGVESNLLTLRDYITGLNNAITQLTTLINYQGNNCN